MNLEAGTMMTQIATRMAAVYISGWVVLALGMSLVNG